MKPDSLWSNYLDEAAVRGADITYILVGLMVLMIFALIAEQFRQKAIRRKRVAAEWETVKQIARDKQLGTEDWELLRGLVMRCHPDEPLRAVTVRYDYDKCVDQEMESLLRKGQQDQYDRAGIILRDIRVHLGLDFIPYGQRIHSTRELGTGQVVTLWPAGQIAPTRRQMRIVSLDEAYMHLAPLALGDEPTWKPSPKDMLRGQVWRDDDARYLFSVAFVREESNPRYWVVQHTADLNRMQSRDYFRVHYDRTVMVGVMEPPPGGDESKLATQPITARIRGRITSLSAGGYAMVVQQAVPSHVFLRVHLELHHGGVLDLDSRIVATTMLGGGRTLVRGSFVHIDEETRDKLVHFVTVLQQQPAEPAGPVEAKD